MCLYSNLLRNVNAVLFLKMKNRSCLHKNKARVRIVGFLTHIMIVFQTLWEQSKGLLGAACEHVVALYVDKNLEPLALCLLGAGDRDGCMIHPRAIFRIAVQLNAHAVVLGHTHPSGNPDPSEEDIFATRAIDMAGRQLRIPLIGHLILTRDGWRLIDDSG